MNNDETLPLTGVKVLDMSRLLPGPWATQMLGDLGADVIKIEDAKDGDPSRHNRPQYAKDSSYFHSVNANKRSIAIDLKTAAGRAVAQRLLGQVDVAVQSFRPGTAAKLGIGYQDAKRANPRIIYCSISGFGQTGPLSHIAGHDLMIQAMTGFLGCAPDGEAPVPGFQAADFVGALSSVIGIMAGLAKRAQTGEGCEIDLAMFESMFNLSLIPLSSYFAGLTGRPGQPRMETFGGSPRYNTYATKDGRRVAVTLLESKSWNEFCRLIGREDLVSTDESLADRLSSHGEKGEVYAAVLRDYCGSRTWDELLQEMNKIGLAIGPVCMPDEAANLEHVKARGLIEIIEHPVEGKIPHLVSPFRRSGLARKAIKPAPTLGEHSLSILSEHGFSSAEIKSLGSSGAVRFPEAAG